MIVNSVGELVAFLIDRRRELRLHQWEVAERMGTSQPALARLETGNRGYTPSTETFLKWFAALGVQWSVDVPRDLGDYPGVEKGP